MTIGINLKMLKTDTILHTKDFHKSKKFHFENWEYDLEWIEIVSSEPVMSIQLKLVYVKTHDGKAGRDD